MFLFFAFSRSKSVQRFVSKRSSSSVDLDSSSLDDLRTEQAAIALSVGLSWPPHKRRRSAGRHQLAAALGNVLSRSTSYHHELPHGVPLAAAWLVAEGPLGRKIFLSPADTTRLSEHILRVTDVLCFSAMTIRGLFARKARLRGTRLWLGEAAACA